MYDGWNDEMTKRIENKNKGKGEKKKKKSTLYKKKKEHPKTSPHTAEQKNVALLR